MIKSLCYVLCLMVGVSALWGCVEEYEADIAEEDSTLLVFEGTICSGKLNTFYLSVTQPVNSVGLPRRVVGAKVSVRGSDGSEYVAIGVYEYYTCMIDTLYPDVEYLLHIEIDGDVYESEPQKPLPTEGIAEVRGVQNTQESNIDVLVTPDEPFAADKTNYYSWTYDETWEVYPEYTIMMYFDTDLMEPVYKEDLFPERGWKDSKGSTIMVGASMNYEGHHIRGLKLYDIDRGNERIFHRYSGLVHQRAISKAEYEYELARRQAGSEMGGLFTPLPSALPTNIRCLTSDKRVIGFVGCSQNTTDYRFFLNAADISVYRPPRADTRVWLDDCNEKDCYRMVERGFFLCDWQDERGMPDGTLRTAWAHAYQLDVRYQGAYIEKPDFW